jgi:hypothetical protein
MNSEFMQRACLIASQTKQNSYRQKRKLRLNGIPAGYNCNLSVRNMMMRSQQLLQQQTQLLSSKNMDRIITGRNS